MAKANRKPNQEALRTEARDRSRQPGDSAAGRPNPNAAGRPNPNASGRPNPNAAGRPDPNTGEWSPGAAPRSTVEPNEGAAPLTGSPRANKKNNDSQRRNKR